jgi:electron transfer flavoprotein beta subunit
MRIAVCVKRVAQLGGRIAVTPDGRQVAAGASGFTVSPHEECAVEEAVRITERLGGTVTVLTLGPPEAAEQLRDMLALGAAEALLLETAEPDWGPAAIAAAIAAALDGGGYDLLLFGNESADSGGYQVPVRVAHALGLPCVTGIARLEITGTVVTAGRDGEEATEVFELPLPAVVTVREGINRPRYPSLPERLRASRATIGQCLPVPASEGLRTTALRVPESGDHPAELLGTGTGAVPALLQLLDDLGLMS